jgi:hypothetical protein
MVVEMRASHTTSKIHTMNTITQHSHALACIQLREPLLELFCGGDGHVQCLDSSAPQMRGRGSGVVSAHHGQHSEVVHTAKLFTPRFHEGAWPFTATYTEDRFEQFLGQ